VSVSLVGILNVTPDSFSDGGLYLDPEKAIAHARMMRQSGADIIDVGAQSTGPKSKQIGADEEMARLKDIVSMLSQEFPISVDTYYSDVASWALKNGATMINDVTSGSDPKMFSVVADSDCKIVIMFSVQPQPHNYEHLVTGEPAIAGDLISFISNFFEKTIDQALLAGIRKEQIVIDPGMGAYLSSDPKVSWELIKRFSELKKLGFPLMFACSRKGFLKIEPENSPMERDPISALAGLLVAKDFDFAGPDYIRTHNPLVQREFLEAVNQPSP